MNSASTPVLTLPERLRAETQASHRRMEALFGMPRDGEDQRRWLSLFLGFLEPLEAKMVAVLGEDSPLFAGRSKVGWLKEDLKDLGLSDAAVEALPRCSALPALPGVPEALGALYVFEGATLGGQFIARHIQAHVDPGLGRGTRYFRSYGSEVGPRWQAFRAFLLQHARPDSDDRMVAAAQETFTRLHAWCLPAL